MKKYGMGILILVLTVITLWGMIFTSYGQEKNQVKKYFKGGDWIYSYSIGNWNRG
jgi:hypothetical protein